MHTGNQQPNEPMNDLDMNLQPEHRAPSRFKRRGLGDKKRWFIIGGAAAAVLVIGVAAYLLLAKDDPAPAPAQSNTPTTQEEPAEDETPSPDAAVLQTYKSEKLNLEISHRKDWTAKASPDELTLTITSPSIAYQTKEGAVAKGKGVFTLKIGQGVTSEQARTINAARAARDSEIIAYAAPTPAQRLYTNISYGGQEGIFNFFMVTGSNAFKAGDPMTGGLLLNSDTFLVVGGYGADKEETLTFDDIEITDMEQSPAYTQAMDIVKSLKVF